MSSSPRVNPLGCITLRSTSVRLRLLTRLMSIARAFENVFSSVLNRLGFKSSPRYRNTPQGTPLVRRGFGIRRANRAFDSNVDSLSPVNLRSSLLATLATPLEPFCSTISFKKSPSAKFISTVSCSCADSRSIRAFRALRVSVFRGISESILLVCRGIYISPYRRLPHRRPCPWRAWVRRCRLRGSRLRTRASAPCRRRPAGRPGRRCKVPSGPPPACWSPS